MQTAAITSALDAALPSPNSPDFAASVRHLPPARQRKVVAQAFEAIFLRELLAPVMNSMAGGGAGTSGAGPGAGTGIYGYLLTDAFAQNLSADGGLGLAGMIEKQFTPPAAHPATPALHPLKPTPEKS